MYCLDNRIPFVIFVDDVNLIHFLFAKMWPQMYLMSLYDTFLEFLCVSQPCKDLMFQPSKNLRLESIYSCYINVYFIFIEIILFLFPPIWAHQVIWFPANVAELTILETADFDLTGQLVWPGALLMNNYLSKHAHLLQGCSIIELGSGVGMYTLTEFDFFPSWLL